MRVGRPIRINCRWIRLLLRVDADDCDLISPHTAYSSAGNAFLDKVNSGEQETAKFAEGDVDVRSVRERLRTEDPIVRG